MSIDHYATQLSAFCSLATFESATCLDIACGPGNYSRYLLSQIPNLKLLGIDLAPNMIELAQQNNANASFKVMDCRKISTLEDTYNLVVCAFCTPYLSLIETTKLINDIFSLLTNNGLLYLSTMEDDYVKSGFETGSKGDSVFIHYYDESLLSSILIAAGFTIDSVARVNSTMGNGKKVTDLILIAKK